MEKRLIRRAQKGDADSYAQLFAKYEADLYRMAYVYSGRREDALDLVQVVAYRSFKYIHSLKDPRYVKTWLVRILINCANDFYKKRPDTKEYEDDAFIEDEQVDVKVTLEAAMKYLTVDEKNIILLKYYEDWTVQQIADALDMKLGTVKTILYRALRKLRDALEKEGTAREIF